MTKDISLIGNPAATDAASPPPGPASAKGPKPGREFASVMEQAAGRKSKKAERSTLNVERTTFKESPTHGVARGRAEAAQEQERESEKAERSTLNIERSTFKESPTTGVAHLPEEEAQEQEAVGEEAGVEHESKNAEGSTFEESPANIVPFPGAMAQAAVIIPFPVAQAQAAPVAVATRVTAGEAGGLDAASGGDGSVNAGRVLVPLPLPNAGSVEAPEAAVMDGRSATIDAEEGIDVAKLGLRPVKSEETIDPRLPVAAPTSSAVADAALAASAQSKVISVVFGPQPGAESGHGDVPGAAPAPAHLPGEMAQRVESAPSTSVPESSAKMVLLRTDAAKSAIGGGLTPTAAGAPSRPETTGTSVAKQEVRMESLMTSGHEAATTEAGEELLEQWRDVASKPAGREPAAGDLVSRDLLLPEGQAARAVSEADFAEVVAEGVKAADSTATVERISSLITRESALVRKHGSDSMAVVLRPDAETELFVHLSQRDGQFEATVRLERGDAHHLGALWSQLQDSLAQQKIRLAPLQEASGGHSTFHQSPHGSGMSGGQNGAREEARPEKRYMDDRPAPAVPAPSAPHVRGTGGSRRRRLTTSRPGWETWA